MKINFKEIKVYQDIAMSEDLAVIIDIRKEFANIMYQSGNGISSLNTALKIYRSDGEEEYTEEECREIRNAAAVCRPMFLNSINMILDKEDNV